MAGENIQNQLLIIQNNYFHMFLGSSSNDLTTCIRQSASLQTFIHFDRYDLFILK